MRAKITPKPWRWAIGFVLVATLCGRSHAQVSFCTSTANVTSGGLQSLSLNRGTVASPGETCAPNTITSGTCYCQDTVVNTNAPITHRVDVTNSSGTPRNQSYCLTTGTTACACFNVTVNSGSTYRGTCSANDTTYFGGETRLLTTRFSLQSSAFFSSAIRLSFQEATSTASLASLSSSSDLRSLASESCDNGSVPPFCPTCQLCRPADFHYYHYKKKYFCQEGESFVPGDGESPPQCCGDCTNNFGQPPIVFNPTPAQIAALDPDVSVITSPGCEIRTDYGPGGCSGTYTVHNLTELQNYVENNFGYDGSNFKNLKIAGNLSGDLLDIESPCQITVEPRVRLSGNFVSLDGRKGVTGFGDRINASEGTACLLSAQGDASVAFSAINAGTLTAQAPHGIAKVGGLIKVQDVLQVGVGATLQVSDDTTADFTSMDSILQKALVSAGSVEMAASDEARVGPFVLVKVRGDMEIRSDDQATIDQHSIVRVTKNLHMQAASPADCLVSGTAHVSFASKSGNCAGELP